jgi:hypothetical protein
MGKITARQRRERGDTIYTGYGYSIVQYTQKPRVMLEFGGFADVILLKVDITDFMLFLSKVTREWS